MTIFWVSAFHGILSLDCDNKSDFALRKSLAHILLFLAWSFPLLSFFCFPPTQKRTFSSLVHSVYDAFAYLCLFAVWLVLGRFTGRWCFTTSSWPYSASFRCIFEPKSCGWQCEMNFLDRESLLRADLFLVVVKFCLCDSWLCDV